MEQTALIKHILEEIQKRGLSRRHLALKAEIPSGRLSEILNGKRPLSPYYAARITRALNLNLKLAKQTTKGTAKPGRPDRILTDEEAQVIQEWYHLAILNLVGLPDSSTNPQWYAERLAISPEQSEKALKRLLKLNLICIDEGRFVRTNNYISTNKDIPSSVVRSMHQQMMEKSQAALHRIPVEFRGISHMVLAINPKKIAAAKKEILSFNNRLANLLEEGAQEEVYLLGVQLVPLTRLKASD